MSRIKLDPRLAERLIEGRAGDQAELPPGATDVAHVLEAARRAATEGDDSAMAATVAAMRAVLAPADVAARAALPAPARGWVRSPLPRAATACAAAFTVLFGGLAAAGALPAGAQKPVADLASHIGIQLPEPATSDKPSEKPADAATATTSTTSTTLPTGDTTPTTAPTSETTVTAPACPPPSSEGPNGCVTPLPIPSPTTTVPPTTTTTKPPPPPTTTTSTTVPAGSNQGGIRGRIANG